MSILKLLFLSATLSISAIRLQAQTSVIDSLQKRADTQTGIAKVDALNTLSLRLILIDFKQALQPIGQAQILSKKINYLAGLAEANVNQGICENVVGNTRKGSGLLRLGAQQGKDAKNPLIEGYALTQLGNVYRGLGQYDSAKYWYDQANNLLKNNPNAWQTSVLFRNLGLYYYFINSFEQELVYLHRSLAIRKKLADRILLLDISILLSQAYIRNYDLNSAENYLTDALNYCQPCDGTESQKEMIRQKAVILFQRNKYSEAIVLFNDARQYYLHHGNKQQYTSLLIEMAEVLERIGSYDLSLKNGFDALKIAEDNKLVLESVRARLIIARNYERLSQPAFALVYAEQAIQIAKDIQDRLAEGNGYNLKGLALQSEKKYEEALVNFEKGYALRKAVQDKSGMATSLGNIGEMHEELGFLNTALATQEQAEIIAKSIADQTSLCWAYYNKGKIFFRLKDLANAHHFADLAEQKAIEIRYPFALTFIYPLQRKIQIAKGNIRSALHYSLLHEKLKDSVNATAITNRVLSLESVYDLEKKDQEIEMLNKDKQLQEDQITIQENRIQRQQFFILVSVIALLLLTIIAYTLYRLFKKMARLNREVQERNEEIQTQSEELSETNTSLVSLNQQLAEKQEEIQAQSEELTEANASLINLNTMLAEKNEEMMSQSEELSEANAQFIHLNEELAIKQNELEGQTKELRESYAQISILNESLEQKVNERTHEMQQAYKELDTFFYRSSHDFRRPLTTFMGLSEVAKITVKDKNALDLFEKVKETAVNLDRMLIKLQSISDVGAHQFVYREVSMQTIFESACDTYREPIDQFGIRISVNVNSIKTLLSYPAFLKIIVENLLENAIQFRGQTDPYVAMEATEKNGGVQIVVHDNGQGVEEEYQGRLFDMFFRGNEHSKGNGLGLYIVKKAVDKLSGTVTLETTMGVGTAIRVWIPMKQPNPERV